MASPEKIQADFDRLAVLETEAWNHNDYYHYGCVSYSIAGPAELRGNFAECPNHTPSVVAVFNHLAVSSLTDSCKPSGRLASPTDDRII